MSAVYSDSSVPLFALFHVKSEHLFLKNCTRLVLPIEVKADMEDTNMKYISRRINK